MKPRCLPLAALALALAFPIHADVSLAPSDSGPLKFASSEIERAAKEAVMPVPAVFLGVKPGTEQGYRIERDGESLRVIGGDAVGAMYGGLDIAEAIRHGTLDSLQNSEHSPHIAKRGIKFNIPLDLRTPSYTDSSDAAQANIPEVWQREFWMDYLNAMARHR